MSEEELNLVELVDEDGNNISCEVWDLIEFEEKTYAILVPVNTENSEEPEQILLEYVEEGDECTFVSIEDEDEFNRVWDYIETLVDDIEE